MVCKEEIYMWFKALKGYKRIEVMCGLLNMCCPLELRFTGTCLEDLGRRDFYTLREEEIKANNLLEILKVSNIIDRTLRHKLIVTLGLLKSTNMKCSNAIFKFLSEEIKVESMASAGMLNDSKTIEEILLLLTLGQNHPAFTFDQQSFLSELCASFERYAQELSPEFAGEKQEIYELGIPTYSINTSSALGSEMGSYSNSVCHHPDQSSPKSSATCQARIVNLKVKGIYKETQFRIRVSWCTGKFSDTVKTPYEIMVFHQKLTQLFPQEAKANCQEKHIPHLPSVLQSANKQEIITDSLMINAADYLRQLCAYLPAHLLECDHMINFFQPLVHGRGAPSRNNRNGDTFPSDNKSTRLRSLTIYNSHISEGSAVSRNKNSPNPTSAMSVRKISENGNSVVGQSVTPPLTSPLLSPTSSPYVSPPTSGTNSRSASPWTQRRNTNGDRLVSVTPDSITLEKLLLREQLHDYWECLRHYRIEDLQVMAQEELECLGILKDAAVKVKRMLESIRLCPTPNGMAGHFISRNPTVRQPSLGKGNLLLHQASNENSPVCSEYSSPPPSPSPTDTCNSSSSEEVNGDKTASLFKSSTDVYKGGIEIDQSLTEAISKQTEEPLITVKEVRECNRHVTVALQHPMSYAPGVASLPQSHKPSFLPLHCRTNPGPHHLPHGAVIFDSQFSRVPLPSALTLLPHSAAVPQRPHAGTPERVLTSSTGLPITTVCPFPIVTSGCSTMPITSCSVATYKSCSSTTVTNCVLSGSGAGRQSHKSPSQSRENDSSNHKSQQQLATENLYAQSCAYLLSPSVPNQQAVSSNCSCLCTSSSLRPSPTPSPSLSPGSAPPQQALPVSLPYIGLPYMFPPTIPFLQTHSNSPANGFISPPTLPTPSPGHSFGFTLPNGMSGIPPELIYGGQAFSLPSPSQGNPSAIAAPVSQGYLNSGNYPQAASVSAMAVTHTAVKLATCYNCGKFGHRGPECKEQSIDEMSKPSKYQLNYAPVASTLETHE